MGRISEEGSISQEVAGTDSLASKRLWYQPYKLEYKEILIIPQGGLY